MHLTYYRNPDVRVYEDTVQYALNELLGVVPTVTWIDDVLTIDAKRSFDADDVAVIDDILDATQRERIGGTAGDSTLEYERKMLGTDLNDIHLKHRILHHIASDGTLGKPKCPDSVANVDVHMTCEQCESPNNGNAFCVDISDDADEPLIHRTALALGYKRE